MRLHSAVSDPSKPTTPFDLPETGSHPSGFINVAPSSSARGGADSRARYAEVRKGMAADPAAKAQQAALLQEADTLQQALVFRPEHASTLHGLHMKHPSLAGAVRLALRWLSAHMFLNHVEHEIVELLVAVRVCSATRGEGGQWPWAATCVEALPMSARGRAHSCLCMSCLVFIVFDDCSSFLGMPVCVP